MPIGLSATLLALAGETIALHVSYEAVDGCPDRAAFFRAVQARTDHVHAAEADEPALELGVRVTGALERGYHGELRNLAEPREPAARSVDGATCKEVVEALSLTLALSLDPDAHAPEPLPAAAPQASVLPAPLPVRAAPAARMRLELGASVLATWLDTSGVSTGGALSAGVLRETSGITSGSLELSLIYVQDRFPRIPDDHRARFGALGLDVCPVRAHWRAVELAPCALAMFGVLEVSGRDRARDETVDRSWWSAGLELKSAISLERNLIFQAALAGSVPLVERRYFANDPGNVVLKTPAISTLLRIGIGYRF